MIAEKKYRKKICGEDTNSSDDDFSDEFKYSHKDLISRVCSNDFLNTMYKKNDYNSDLLDNNLDSLADILLKIIYKDLVKIIYEKDSIIISGKGPDRIETSGKGNKEEQKDSSNSRTTESGLIISDIIIGDGYEAEAGQTVTVDYTGTLKDGTQFDTSIGKNPFSFTLGAGRAIKGWDEGVVGMRVGGKRKLTIPPELGYGSRGAGTVIPPNSTLIFVIELLEIKNIF